ncbi:MAG: delta 1-pyrroline-5-carboxylate synthetase [Nitrososphaerota archaeon]|nr:delta 1-pyrroline-5-carboxylate synthetase [Candidatus Bathyarchaeota archaeon]MDW8193633.1 delta 1-pyrroline-5-carboxylate synthetase [Nitrososphaerota archaeon]
MEAVVKVGGSLSADPSSLKALCRFLGGLAGKHRIMIVPGGGGFADTVRRYDGLYGLPAAASHRMAILAMDQYGLLLGSLTPNSFTTTSLVRACKAGIGSLPILLPSRLLFQRDPLENSWRVTSDSIAAYIAAEAEAGRLILAKDVDGIFTEDPKSRGDAVLIRELSASELQGRRTCVDEVLPKLLMEKGLNCYVVNGKNPDRIESILKGENAVYTHIIPV